MDLKEIADGLTAQYNIGGLSVEDGEMALEIDGMPILLAEGEGAAIVMTGLVGDAPAEGGDVFANLLLEGTMGLMDAKAFALARNPETGAYALVARVPQEGLTLDAFSETLADFVNQLEQWRGVLENFRPIAAEAKAFAEAQPDAKEFERGGFMQV